MRPARNLPIPSPEELELIVTPHLGSPLKGPPAKPLALSRVLALYGAGAAVLMAIVLATDSVPILVGVSIAALGLVSGVLWRCAGMSWERLRRALTDR